MLNDFMMFVAGTLFIVLILPILQTLSDIICGFGQWVLSIFNLHIAKNNSIIQNYQDPVNAQAIGFQVPDDEECYDDENESEEKLKIGFRG